MSVASARDPLRDVDGTRARVIHAAREIFAEHGYRGSSLDLIAHAADVPVAVLRTYFDTCEQALVTVLMARDDADGEDVQIYDRLGVLEFLELLKELVASNERRPVAVKLHARMTVEASDPKHPAYQWAQDRYRWQRSLFAGAIQTDMRAGRIRDDVDSRAVATQIIAVMDGLGVQWLLHPEDVQMSRQFNAYADALAASLHIDGAAHA